MQESSNNDVSKLKILLEYLKHKYDFLIRIDDALESKAGNMLNFCLALGVGYATLALPKIYESESIKNKEGFYMVGLALLALSIILIIILYWPRNFRPIVSFDIRKHKKLLSKKFSERKLVLQLISNTENAHQKNRHIVKNKARLIKLIKLIIIAAGFLLTAPFLPFI